MPDSRTTRLFAGVALVLALAMLTVLQGVATRLSQAPPAASPPLPAAQGEAGQ